MSKKCGKFKFSVFCSEYHDLLHFLCFNFLTAISFAIAVLGMGPKLLIFSALSFAEHCRVLLSRALTFAEYCCVLLSSSVSRAEQQR